MRNWWSCTLTGEGKGAGSLFPAGTEPWRRLWLKVDYSQPFPCISLTLHLQFPWSALHKQATAFSMCQGERNLKTFYILGSDSVSLSPPLDFGAIEQRGLGPGRSTQTPREVSETSLHVRIGGVYRQCFWPQVQRWEKPRPHILVGLEDTVLEAFSPWWRWIEMNQEHHPASAFLMLME